VNSDNIYWLRVEGYSIWGLPFLDVISTECSVLCPIALEKLQATRAGFEPATPAFQCRRLNHLTTELVAVKWRIRKSVSDASNVYNMMFASRRMLFSECYSIDANIV
jgi:hypothetical protein